MGCPGFDVGVTVEGGGVFNVGRVIVLNGSATAIREYVAITNEAPRPFVWTKTADEILTKVAGFCQRISDPGH
jgi:hypothetical protein